MAKVKGEMVEAWKYSTMTQCLNVFAMNVYAIRSITLWQSLRCACALRRLRCESVKGERGKVKGER